MNANISNKLSKGLYRAAIAVAAIGIAAAGPAIQAKPNPNKGEDKPANVVAHVQLSGGPVTRMLLLKKEGKEYLLVGLNSTARVPCSMSATQTGRAPSIPLRPPLEHRPPK